MGAIKCKAWDKENKVMINWEDLKFEKDTDENEICFYEKVDECEFDGGLEVELMPYTGLHDTDKAEICKGSILMLNNNKLDLVQVCFGEFYVCKHGTEEIIDKVIGWYAKPIKTNAISECEPFCYEFPLNEFYIKSTKAKVIGNIYENQELLNS